MHFKRATASWIEKRQPEVAGKERLEVVARRAVVDNEVKPTANSGTSVDDVVELLGDSLCKEDVSIW